MKSCTHRTRITDCTVEVFFFLGGGGGGGGGHKIGLSAVLYASLFLCMHLLNILTPVKKICIQVQVSAVIYPLYRILFTSLPRAPPAQEASIPPI